MQQSDHKNLAAKKVNSSDQRFGILVFGGEEAVGSRAKAHHQGGQQPIALNFTKTLNFVQREALQKRWSLRSGIHAVQSHVLGGGAGRVSSSSWASEDSEISSSTRGVQQRDGVAPALHCLPPSGNDPARLPGPVLELRIHDLAANMLHATSHLM